MRATASRTQVPAAIQPHTARMLPVRTACWLVIRPANTVSANCERATASGVDCMAS
jgi:hypothetical protein